MRQAGSTLPSFAVVIPAYNEGRALQPCVEAVCAVLERLPNRTALLCVNDGSRDNTSEVLAELGQRLPKLRCIEHDRNRGYGAALQTGARHAFEEGFEYALFMDSDGTNHPTDIPRFAEAMATGADVIKATRYSRGGQVVGVPARRVWISRVGNFVAHLLFRLPVHDCTNGFRAVRTKLLVRMQLVENRFPIIMEELYWCRFLTQSFLEIPVTLTDRASDQRPTSFLYKPKVFWDYLKYPLKASLGLRPAKEK